MWIFVQRLSMFLVTVLAGDQLVSLLRTSGEIKSNKVYTVAELSSLLKLERTVVLRLVKEGHIKARMLDGKYKILGQNIKDFLNE